jgi:hypothetical protein
MNRVLVEGINLALIGVARRVFVSGFEAVNLIANSMVYLLAFGSIGKEDFEVLVKHGVTVCGARLMI